MSYVTGNGIRTLREKKKYTQKQLAEKLCVSEKTISKWETGKGLPDISLIEPLAKELQVSVVELLNGEFHQNQNVSANMKKARFYVCPVCGNIIYTMGEGSFNCCGIQLPALSVEEPEDESAVEHQINVERIDDEYYVTLNHSMTKDHFISFIAYVSYDRIQLVKLYPQQSIETRFRICGRGTIYAYCNKHGLFSKKL